MTKQTVLITGASGGIGKALAEIFAQNGFDLVVVARSENQLNTLKQEFEKQYGIIVTVLPWDLTEDNAAVNISAHLEALHISVDVLVNNAGFGDSAAFLDSDWNKQKRMVELNLLALMQMTYVFGNQMRARGNGRILNLSSVAAFFAGPYMSIYYASKSFVLSFSEAVAEELRGTGVTVTALCPGPTTTGFEAAAAMKNSKMFSFAKPQTAETVAKAGYNACMSGKTIRYHSAVTRLANIGTRLASRAVMRKLMGKINGIPEGK